MVTLLCKGFILRAFKSGDEIPLQKNINDKSIYRYTLRIPYPYTLNDAKLWIRYNSKTKIKDYNICNDYTLYFGGYLGNYFAVMLFPEVWSYELFETLAGSSHFTTDFEPYDGRKSYVKETAGGFYASRLPVVEKLIEKKRQASVLVVRVITDEYTIPLGVFVVREAVRKAMDSKPIHFSSSKLMIDYASTLISNKFSHKINNVIGSSKLLRNIKTQKKLTNF